MGKRRCLSFFCELVNAGKESITLNLKSAEARWRDSFYVANDKLTVLDKTIRLPKIGNVVMTESLRLDGRMLGATVSRTADRWFVAVQVEVPDEKFHRPRTAHHITGVDLGVKTLATLSNGASIEAPKTFATFLAQGMVPRRNKDLLSGALP